MNPTQPISTPSKTVPANVHLHPTDDLTNTNARSRSTHLQNSFHTRHREKNRKNKQEQPQLQPQPLVQPQESHYYIKHQYYPYNPSSTSSPVPSTAYLHQTYEIEFSRSEHRQCHFAFLLLLLFLLYSI